MEATFARPARRPGMCEPAWGRLRRHGMAGAGEGQLRSVPERKVPSAAPCSNANYGWVRSSRSLKGCAHMKESCQGVLSSGLVKQVTNNNHFLQRAGVIFLLHFMRFVSCSAMRSLVSPGDLSVNCSGVAVGITN